MGEGWIFFIMLIAGLFVYFIPSLVAWNKKQANGVIAINLFLGWTFIGWVAALAWACLDSNDPQIIEQPQSEDKFDKLAKLKSLLDSGAITKEEFEKEKSALLQRPPLITE